MRRGAVLVAACILVAAAAILTAQEPEQDHKSSARATIEAIRRLRDWSDPLDFKVDSIRPMFEFPRDDAADLVIELKPYGPPIEVPNPSPPLPIANPPLNTYVSDDPRPSVISDYPRLRYSEHVSLNHATKQELKLLENISKDVVSLQVTYSSVDDFFDRVRHFDKLESLTLTECVFESRTIGLLRAERLTRLQLGGAGVIDDDLEAIDERLYRSLQELRLNLSQITDHGVAQLFRCGDLQLLDLADTAVGDASLAAIVKLKNLETLNLEFTRVTDAGLRELSQLQNLRDLNLAHTGISDAGLKLLDPCQSLRRIDLRGTKVTRWARDGWN